MSFAVNVMKEVYMMEDYNWVDMMEKMQEVFELFSQVPDNLTDDKLDEAFFRYDGEPYCELVCCGIEIIRKYLKKRSEYDEWQKKNLQFSV